MSDVKGSRATVALALAAALAAGSCAPSTLAAPADTGERAPSAADPSNFASPTDIIQRYPTMRHQQL